MATMNTEKQATARQISPEGRAAQSAAGKASLPALLEARRAVTSAKQSAIDFEAGLIAELGGEPTATQRASVVAATACYTALFIASQKLRTAHRSVVIAGLVEQITPLTGALRRSLRDLGFSAPEPADERGDQPPGGALAEYLASKARGKEGSDGSGDV
jgi:hypothetical protein